MADHYVSPSGSATWAASTSIDTPTSIATANANVVAGDTVYLRGGTYYYYINPAHSGTDIGNRVIYEAYTGETPTFTVDEAGGRWAIRIQNRSWVKVDGIRAYNSRCFFYIGYGSCYNELVNCDFDTASFDYQQGYITYRSTAGAEGPGSNHNWIHDCTFTKYGAVTAAWNDLGTIRVSANYNDPSRNNTIEDCVFSYGGHDCLSIAGQYNVVRSCVLHNEEAYFAVIGSPTEGYNDPPSGYFGNRCILLENGGEYIGTAQHNLIEGCRIGHSGTPPDDDGASGIENAGVHTIARFNDIYNAGGVGYYGKNQPAGGGSTTLQSQSYARVYNNTIYHSGYGDADIQGTQFHYGVIIWSYSTDDDWPTDVVLKNNIVNDSVIISEDEKEWRVGTANILPQITYENNWGKASADPLFVNPNITDPTSLVLPDLTLQAGSPCLRAGTYMTLANGAGTASTLLAVDDAYPFQDGSWGSDLARAGFFPDWIAIGSVTNVVEIESVDYGTRVITLASPMTWADNAPVWLYMKSDGSRVLYGSAPEVGAHPYVGGGVTDTPLVPAAAAVAHASTTPTLSPGADYDLIVAGADVEFACESPGLMTAEESAWAIRLGPLNHELTLPALNWLVGSRPTMRKGKRVSIDRVEVDDGAVRYYYRPNAPGFWTLEWARLGASDVLAIRGLAAYNEPLHYRNRIDGVEWTWVIIDDFRAVPIAATFATGAPQYRATLELREAL